MKIITVNRNYFVTGGPEKYLFALQKAIEPWETIPFSVNFSKNRDSIFRPYFVSPPSRNQASRFDEQHFSIWQKINYACRSIYSFEAKKKLLRLIDDTQPQAAFFLNVVYFSQSIIDACRKRNLPIIWRLSDFNHICGNYLLYRNSQTCEKCVENGLYPLIKNRCGGYQRSLSAALVRYAGMRLARLRDIYRHIHYFVCPSAFTRGMLIKAGFPEEKVVHLPTFISSQERLPPGNQGPVSFLYVGRFTPEKGLHTLITAIQLLHAKDWRLILVGGTEADYESQTNPSLTGKLRDRIVFAGFVPPEKVKNFIAQCHFNIVPSLWYENQPNTVLEAMSFGRPVIASRLGSLAETVIDGETGLLFEPGNPTDLALKIDHLLAQPNLARSMGEKAYRYVTTYHNCNDHVLRLKQLFKTAAYGNAHQPAN